MAKEIKFHHKIGVFSVLLSIPFFVMFMLVNIDFVSVSMEEKLVIYKYCMVCPLVFIFIWLISWVIQGILNDIDKIEK